MIAAQALGALCGTMAGIWAWTAAERLAPAVRAPHADAPGHREHPPRRTTALFLTLKSLTCEALTLIGGTVRRRILRCSHSGADRFLAGGLVAGILAAAALHVVAGLALWGLALARPLLEARRCAREQTSAVVDQLPDVVDLLRLTTLAGLPVSAAILAIGARPGGVLGNGLQRATQKVMRGATTSDALDALVEVCGPPVRPLVDALIDHVRYGTPLGPALDRVGIESRMRRRQQAEEAARRLPVTLLFPLVLTTLPACVLLTVVPLGVASLSALS